MKVLGIVINYFTHESRVLKEAETLIKNKYEFHVVSLHKEPLPTIEIMSGVRVNRIPLLLSKVFDSKGFLFLKNKLGFLKLLQLILLLEFVVKISFRFRGYQYFHCYSILGLIVGTLLKICNPSTKLIYDAREYETETYFLNGFRKKAFKFLERFCLKFVYSTITVSNSIAEEYVRLYGIAKPHLVLNCPKLQEMIRNNYFRTKYNIADDALIFLYQGAIVAGRGVDTIVEVFKKLAIEQKYICVFLGYRDKVDEIRLLSSSYKNIFYHDPVSTSELLEYTASADVGLCLIEDKCLSYHFCLPNKLFEYFMAEIPCVVNGLPVLSKIVDEYQVGCVVDAEDIDNLVTVIKNIDTRQIEKWRQNTDSVKKVYNWENQERELLLAYGN